MALTVSTAITDIDLTTANISQIVTAMRASVQGGPLVLAHVYCVTVIPVSNTQQRILMLYD
jgi:hypothetical protein